MAVDNQLLIPDVWDDKWNELFLAYQSDLRHAYYLNALLDSKYTILELAAGSFRDMAFLNQLGYDCHGCDFSFNSVIKAQNHFSHLSKKIFHADAERLESFNKTYDVTYHNGFWVLFDDDNKIYDLYTVQKKITNKFLIITVHNGHNKEFKNYFLEKRKFDNLYAIRFFEIEEMLKILNLTYSEVSVYPVGKGKKANEDLLFIEGNTNKTAMSHYLRANNFNYLESSERLMFQIFV